MGDRNQMRLCLDADELTTLPYVQRQFIIVVDDEIVKAELDAREEAIRIEAEKIEAKRVEAQSKGEEDNTRWDNVLDRLRQSRLRLDVSSLPMVEGIADTLSRDNEIDALTLSYSTASCLVFPHGHPRFDTLYVGHPALPNTYYTAASFHRLTFEHKFSEALILLMALGATRVTVNCISGFSQEFAAKANTPAKIVGGEAARKNKSDSRIFFEAHLEGAAQPHLPNDFVWYRYEPTWQAIAEGRINYGLKNFKLILEYADDFNVNAQLSAKANNIGLELGGNFTDFQKTVWHMDGEFPDK